MKTIVKLLSFVFYFFILLGIVCHTSNTPVILNKYSLKYLIGIVAIVCLFPLYFKITDFIIYGSAKSSKSSKKTWKNNLPLKLLMVILLLVFGTVVGEGLIRLNYMSKIPACKKGAIENYDPFLQYKLDRANPCDRALPVNKEGFRAEEISKIKPVGVYRIMVAGGSTVLSRSIPFEQTNVRILEKLLKAYYPDKKIEVINAGMDGYTTEHSLIQYLFRLKDYNPDLIIMWHGINDLYYSFSPKGFSNGSFRSDYAHMFGSASNIVMEYYHLPTFVAFPYIYTDTFNIGRLLQVFIHNILYSDFGFFGKPISTDGLQAVNMGIENFPSLNSFRNNLIEFIKILKSDDVKLLLGTQPYLYRSGLDKQETDSLVFAKTFCVRGQTYPDTNSMAQAMSQFNRVSKEAAKQYKVPLVDLEAALPKTKEFFKDDVHFTATGEERVAETIFHYITENHLIE